MVNPMFTLLLHVTSITATISYVSTPLSSVKVQYLVSTSLHNVASSPGTFFTRTLGYQFDDVVRHHGTNSSAGDTDDTPLESIPLGFPFSYYGKQTTTVWVNPNGGLQFIPAPPCGCCFSTYTNTGECNFNSSYYDMVALSVTDLAPIDNPACHVRYNTLAKTTAENVFGLTFVDVPMFGTLPKPGPTWTFGLTIAKKGQIMASYKKIFDTKSPPGNPPPQMQPHVTEHWLVGLRAPKSYDDALKAVDPTQLFRNQRTWETSIRGSYPARNEVANGLKIMYCPVPTSLCLQPDRGHIQGSGAAATLTLTGNSPFGCNRTDMPLKCRFHLPSNDQDSRFNGDVDTEVLSMTNDGIVVDSGGTTSITCQTPTIVATTVGGSALGWIDIDIVYPTKQGRYDDSPVPFSSLEWAAMPTASPLRFQFLAASGTGPTDTCGAGQNVCDHCGSCGGSNSCISSTCDGRYNSQNDCAGVCNGPGVIGTDLKCCESPSLLDCNGVCNGSTIEAWVQFPSILAKGCCLASQVDCTGLCGGRAEIDRCGVCAEGTTGRIANADMDCLGLCPNDPDRFDSHGNKLPCDPSIDIGIGDAGDGKGGESNTNSSGGQRGGQGGGSSASTTQINTYLNHNGGLLVWEIDNSNIKNGQTSSSTRDTLVRVWNVVIRNDGPLRVYINDLKVTNSKTTSHPPISVLHNAGQADFGDGRVLILPPRATVTINITIDMRTVLVDPIVPAPRRNKAVQFQYTYGGPKANVFPVFIPIKVNVTSCTVFTTMERCANVPSCTYCLGSPSLFVNPWTNRRELKSPLPTIEPGTALAVPKTGQCMREREDNTCVWDESSGKVLGVLGGSWVGLGVVVVLWHGLF